MQLAPREALQAGAARYSVDYGYEPEVHHWSADVNISYYPADNDWS